MSNSTDLVRADIVLGILCVLSCVPAVSDAAVEWQVRQLTHSSTCVKGVGAWGNSVVWSEKKQGTWGVYLHDGEAIRVLDTGMTYAPDYLSIVGGRIGWLENVEDERNVPGPTKRMRLYDGTAVRTLGETQEAVFALRVTFNNVLCQSRTSLSRIIHEAA